MAVARVEELTKSYGRVRALDGVTLEFQPGVTGLLGPNGAGKSTLLLCILGLLQGWRGRAEVLGLDVRRNGLEVRRRVGFMPELDAYLPEMTGIRAVRYLGRLTGLSASQALRRAHEVLWHVGLGEAIYRDVREYSLGMRQRFKLAQALVHDPEVLFLDEPLGGLDPGGRDELLDLVRDLAHRHGKHVIWSSHILPEVQKVADHVVILHAGRYRGGVNISPDGAEETEEGRPMACLVEVEGDAEAFRRAAESAGASLEARPGAPGPELLERHRFGVTLPAGTSAVRLLEAARTSGTRLRRLAPYHEDLEHVFHRLLEGAEEDA